jgi:MerR family transcriptional regulator, thiopeptide resistance regulator
MMAYTVKQLADLAGVSNRTLHYYDQIGLLTPDAHGENGYRFYGEGAVLRLQQVLFYRELGMSLEEIKGILDRPGFDVLQALQAHKAALRGRAIRLSRLIDTVDRTIRHLRGEIEMSDKEYYEGFSEEQQKEYEAEARTQWGSEKVDESMQRWAGYTPEQKKAIMASGGVITQSICDHMAEGYDSPKVQELIAAWHKHIGFFYECSLEIFAALGHTYNQDPRFAAFYRRFHADMPAFMEKAMTYYCEQQRRR